ncbi:MAG: hypothetical protein AAF495_28875, partial [Pseudomonadota bacterium]
MFRKNRTSLLSDTAIHLDFLEPISSQPFKRKRTVQTSADVCDLDELENGMPRKEGTFGAIYWWMVKLGQAIA